MIVFPSSQVRNWLDLANLNALAFIATFIIGGVPFDAGIQPMVEC